MPLPKPDRFETALESYKTDGILGEGGSGRVFLTKDSKGDEYAVKCLFPELVTGSRLSRFKNELRFCLRNTHPNILHVLDQGFISVADTKTPFYVMRSYPSTLRKIMQSELAADRAYEMFLRILDGIGEAHGRGIWHRDLKPENILLDPSSSDLVVADFGVAHFSEDEIFTEVDTGKSDRLANFKYAAPEQRSKGQAVDHRADIYALGLMLNEMFTGEAPLGTDFAKISDKAPAYAYLDALVDRMIRQSPTRRASSVREVLLELSLAERAKGPGGPIPLSVDDTGEQSSQAQPYIAEVDTAGRLEDASRETVLSVSAGLSFSVSIPAEEKETMSSYLEERFPEWGGTRRRVYLYTLLLFMLLRDYLMKLDLVVIDPEYRGYESLIKGALLTLFRNAGLPATKEQIRFDSINRNSPARQMASEVYRGAADPDLILSARQLIELA